MGGRSALLAALALVARVAAQPPPPSDVTAVAGDRSINVAFNPTDFGAAASYRVTARVQHPYPQFPAPTLEELPGSGDDFEYGSPSALAKADVAKWEEWGGTCQGYTNTTTNRNYACWNLAPYTNVNGTQLNMTAYGYANLALTTYFGGSTVRTDLGWSGTPILGHLPVNVTQAGGLQPFAAALALSRVRSLSNPTFNYIAAGYVLYDVVNGTTPRWVMRYVFLQYTQNSYAYLYLYYPSSYFTTSGGYVSSSSVQVYYAAIFNPPVVLWLVRNPAAGSWQFGYQLAGDAGPTLTPTTLQDSQLLSWSFYNPPLTYNNLRLGITTMAMSSYTVSANFDRIKFYTRASFDRNVAYAQYWGARAQSIARLGACAVSRDVTTVVRAPAVAATVTSLVNGVNYTVEIASVSSTNAIGAASNPVWAVPNARLPVPGARMFLDANSLAAPVFNGSTASLLRLSQWNDLSGADTSAAPYFAQTSASLQPLVMPRGANRPYQSVTFSGAQQMTYAGNVSLHRFDPPTDWENHQMTVFVLYQPKPPNTVYSGGMLLSHGLYSTIESGWHIYAYVYYYVQVGGVWTYPYGYGMRVGTIGSNTANAQANIGGVYCTGCNYNQFAPHPHGNQPTMVTYMFRRTAQPITTKVWYRLDACTGLNQGLSSDFCSLAGDGTTANPATSWNYYTWEWGTQYSGNLVQFPITGFAPQITSQLTLGAFNYYNGLYFTDRWVGDLHALAIYRGAMSQPDMLAVQTYLTDRYYQRCPPLPPQTGAASTCGSAIAGATCPQTCDSTGNAPGGLKYARSGGANVLRCSNGAWLGKSVVCGAQCPSISTPSSASACTKYFVADNFERYGAGGTDVVVNYSSLFNWDATPVLPILTGDTYWRVTGGKLVATLPTRDDECSSLDSSALFVSNPDWMSGVQLTDAMTTEVDVVPPMGARAGVLFRVISNSTYYRFTIGTEGAANVVRLEYITNFATVARPNWTWPVPWTFQSDRVYRLRVTAAARSVSDLTARILGYVNDTLVFNVTDAAIPLGVSGVYAEAGVATFDNFNIYGPCDNSGMACRNMFNRMECRYTCGVGTRPSGSDRLTCGANGTYITAAPDCIPFPPTFTTVWANVSEAATAGTIFVTLNATAAGPGQIVLYSIDPLSNSFVMRDRFGNVRGTATDVFAVNVCSGELRLNKNGVLDARVGPTLIPLNVSACVNGRNDSCTWAYVNVNVDLAQMAPYFEADPVSGGTGTWVRSVNENVPVGTVISPALVAYNPNGNANRYSISFGDPAGVFSLNPTTGVLSVAKALINFEVQPVYNLLAAATDAVNGNLTGTVFLTINVVDLNDAPIVPPVQTFTVLESSTFGNGNTTIGSLVGYDEDLNQVTNWGPASPHPNVTIPYDSRAGRYAPLLMWATGTSPSAWKRMYPNPYIVDDLLVRTVLEFNVSLTDSATPPLASQSRIRVYVLVNTDLSATEPALERVTYNLTVGARGIPTTGGTIFSILGRNFNYLPSQSVTVTLVPQANDPFPSRSYSPTCNVVSTAEIRCISTPGFGANLTAVVLNSAGEPLPSTSAILVSYRAPFINAIVPLQFNGSNTFSLSAMNTAGGQYFWLVGSNLWAPGAPPEAVTLYYALNKKYSAYIAFNYVGNGINLPNITEVANATQVLIRTVEGIGRLHSMQMMFGNQISNQPSTQISYGAASINGVAAPQGAPYSITTLSPQGGQDIVITGANFGPVDYVPTFRYGNKNGISVNRDGVATTVRYMYVATNCRKDPATPHTRMTCSTARGLGTTLRSYITTTSSTSEIEIPTSLSRFYMRYAGPNVTSISGPGSRAGDTEGSVSVTFAGYNLCLMGSFGDATYTGTGMVTTSFFSITYGPSTGNEYIMRSCACVSEVPNTVTCQTAPGIGKNLLLRVSASGSAQVNTPAGISYGVPVITGYARLDNQSVLSMSTVGGDRMRITGRNFGPSINTARFAAEYTTRLRQASTEFGTMVTTDPRQVIRFSVPTSSCTMTVAHRELQCTVGNGAGTDLVWNITIGFQSSSLPTTSYSEPMVLGLFKTDGVSLLNDANTEGGDVVLIRGANFGPGEASNLNCVTSPLGDRRCYGYVQDLRFGPTGTEFRFDGFTVKDHNTIWGWLPAGYGTNLRVTVTVADQVSSVNATVGFGYATPTVLTVSPATGTTNSQFGTRVAVTVTGKNWGLLDPSSTVGFAVGNPADGTMVGPIQPTTVFPDPTNPSSIAAFRALASSARISTATFWLPVGLLAGRAVRVMTYPSGTSDPALRVFSDAVADSATSLALYAIDRTRFSYNPPVVTGHLLQSVTAYSAALNGQQRANLLSVVRSQWPSTTDQGNVRVLQLQGADFGPSQSVRADNVSRVVEGLPVGATSATSTAWSSDAFVIYSWDHTTIVVLTLQPSGTVRVRVDGATFEGTPTGYTSNERVYSAMAPLVTRVIGTRSGFNTSGAEVLSFEVQYLADVSSDLWIAIGSRNCTLLTSAGAEVTDSGAAAVEFVKSPTALATYSTLGAGQPEQERLWQLRCKTPPGEGRGRGIIVHRDVDVSSSAVTIDYTPPRVTAFTVDGVRRAYVGTAGRAGNQLVVQTPGSAIVLEGRNFGLCPQVQVRNVWWALGDASVCGLGFGVAGYLPTTTISHDLLAFTSPEGDGPSDDFTVRHGAFFGWDTEATSGVAGATTPMALTYALPTLATVTPFGHTPGGEVMEITGTNFGVGTPSVRLGDDRLPCTGVNRTSHFALTCTTPAGRGANLTVVVTVNRQASQTNITFSYFPPVIESLSINGGEPSFWFERAGNATPWWSGPTDGGYNVTLTGADFGARATVADGETCVFVAWRGRERAYRTTGFACDNKLSFVGEGEVPDWAVSEWTHDRITFTFPPGAGVRELIPWVKNQGPARPFPWRYSAPAITAALQPALGETLGGQLITMRGANFGRSPRAVLSPADLAARLAEPLPATLDAYLSYAPLPQEMVRIGFFRSCSSAYTDANGNRPTLLAGCNATNIAAHNDSVVQFYSSPGIGVNRSVTVTVIDYEPPADNPLGALVQVAITSNVALFSYLPPEVTEVRPHPVSLAPAVDEYGNAATYPLTLYGRNFGRKPSPSSGEVWTPEELEVHVAVGGVDCLSADRDFRGTPRVDVLVCQMQETVVGYNNITYTVAGQTGFTGNTSSAAVFAACAAGYYGYPGETCLPCPWQDAVPPGAFCAGFDENRIVPRTQSEVDGGTHTYPVPLPGFYNLNGTEASACPPSQFVAGRDVCIVPCSPAESCLGDNWCGVGYASKSPYFRCASCAVGYFKRANQCIKCPDSPYMLVIGFAFLVMVVAGGAYVLNKKKINIAFVSIAIDFFQVLAIFALSDVPWPPALLELFHILSAFNLNIEIVAPECLVPDVSYKQKWAFVMALPVSVAGFFGVVTVASVVWKKNIKGRKVHMANELAAFGSSILLLMYVLYIYLTRTVLEIYNCTPTKPSDGKLYMTAVFEECGVPGGTQVTLLPWAIIASIVYVAGYPAAVGWLLWTYRDYIMEDQLLRAKGVGNDKLTNPHAYTIRKRFSRIYYQFKPDNFMWIEAILARKFCIAATYILFNKNAAFQLAAALLVLFLAYAAQVRTNPYMGPANFEDVLREHVQASYTSAVHARLRATIASIESRGRKRAHRNVLRGDGKVDAGALLGLLTSWLFDYNTVESTMIFAAAIICLMGIMFSAQAQAASYYSAAREALTGVVLTVAIVSILYLVSVIVMEIYILYTEDQRRKALAKKAAAGKGKGDDEKGGSGKALTRRPSARRGDGGKDFVAGDVNNAMNPMFMTAGGASASVATDTNAAAEAIRSMVNPPPTVELWQVYKDTFLQLRGRLEDLKTQLGTFPPEVKTFVEQEAAKAAVPAHLSSALSMRGGSLAGSGSSGDLPSKSLMAAAAAMPPPPTTPGGGSGRPLSSNGGGLLVVSEPDPATQAMGENELAALRNATRLTAFVSTKSASTREGAAPTAPRGAADNLAMFARQPSGRPGPGGR